MKSLFFQKTGQCTRSAQGVAAFTLIEMLAVLGIIGVVAAIAAPAVLGIINSTRLSQAGDDVAARISQAQQISVSESRPVEVRFYSMRDASAADSGVYAYRGIMIVKYYQPGEADPTAPGQVLNAPLAIADFGGIYRLPNNVLMAPSQELSSIMRLPEVGVAGGSSGTQAELKTRINGRYETMQVQEANAYRSFLCLPETTDLNAGQTWFVTLINSGDEARGPGEIKNFYTVQIEPITGRLMSYRP